MNFGFDIHSTSPSQKKTWGVLRCEQYLPDVKHTMYHKKDYLLNKKMGGISVSVQSRPHLFTNHYSLLCLQITW